MQWMDDTRMIRRVKLDGETFFDMASKFTRFERNGEYCMIPWLLIETTVPTPRTIEAPIHKVEWIEYVGVAVSKGHPFP